jgi:hypothetical protein
VGENVVVERQEVWREFEKEYKALEIPGVPVDEAAGR